MRDFDIARDIAAQCRRKAKTAQGEDDKHSWLAMAESWLQTAELQQAQHAMEHQYDLARAIQVAVQSKVPEWDREIEGQTVPA